MEIVGIPLDSISDPELSGFPAKASHIANFGWSHVWFLWEKI